jgi:hypothetical protein
LQQGTPVVAYYDRLRHQLRGAVAQGADAVASGFAVMPVACAAGDDFGQHASLALTAEGLAIAFQGNDGKDLWACTGASFAGCATNVQIVDDGYRGPGDQRLVGAYASLAVDASGELYIAYLDQTENDLVLAYTRGRSTATPGWRPPLALGEVGGHGAFARIRLAGTTAYVSDYHRLVDEQQRDVSRLASCGRPDDVRARPTF